MAVLRNPPSIFRTYPEPVPNPFRAPEPLPRAWMRGGGKLQIDKLSRTRAETICIVGKASRSRYMICMRTMPLIKFMRQLLLSQLHV